MGGLGGGAKVNTNAMESQLNQRLKMAKTKERIRAKAEANAIAKAAAQLQAQQAQQGQQSQMSIEETLNFINSGDKPERTPRGAKPQQQQSFNKKKKGKK